MDVVIIKFIISILLVVFFMRIMGKNVFRVFTPRNLFYILVISELMGSGLFMDEWSIGKLALYIILWAVLIYCFEWIMFRFEWFGKVVKGEPIVIIENGVIDKKKAKRFQLDEKDIKALLRRKNIFNIRQVKVGILEESGEISVIRYHGS